MKVSNGSIVINGNSYSGRNITINNNKVIIDGVVQTFDETEINIVINGDVEGGVELSSGDITIGGSVSGKVSTKSGDIRIAGNTTGDVSSMSGDVNCGSVVGDIRTVTGNVVSRK